MAYYIYNYIRVYTLFSVVRWYKINKLTKALYNARYNYRKYYHIVNDRIKYSREIDRLLYEIQEVKNG